MRILHKTVTTTATLYTVSQYDSNILCDTTSNAITVRLPLLGTAPGKEYFIQSVNASNAVTVAGQTLVITELINGANTSSLATIWDSITVRDVGTHWAIVSTT